MNIKVDELTSKHFDQYPVWTWVEGFEENLVAPVLETDPLPDDLPVLMVKAEFWTPTGLYLSGHVVADLDVYAVVINIAEKEFVFNKHMFTHMRDVSEQSVLELQTILSKENTEIFPLSYKTNYRFHDGKLIAGVFDPSRT